LFDNHLKVTYLNFTSKFIIFFLITTNSD